MVLDVIQAQHGSPVVVAAPLVLLLGAVAQLVLDHLEQTVTQRERQQRMKTSHAGLWNDAAALPRVQRALTRPSFVGVCVVHTHHTVPQTLSHAHAAPPVPVRTTWISHFYKYAASDLSCDCRSRGHSPTHTHARMIKPMPTRTHALTH